MKDRFPKWWVLYSVAKSLFFEVRHYLIRADLLALLTFYLNG